MIKSSAKEVGLVLVAGAGLRSWIWADMAKHLKIPYAAVDFPTGKIETMEDYAQAVVDKANEMDVSKVIIVAHSLGGAVALKAAQALEGKLAGFVAVSASIPKNGGSFVSALPFPQKFIMPIILKLSGAKPPESAIRKGYGNDLPPELIDKVVKEFVEESPEVYMAASAEPPKNIRKLYIKTTNDNEFPAALQEKMSQNLGADKTVSIDSGHLPMLSKPEELAKILNDFAD